jgi:hypothetical protein
MSLLGTNPQQYSISYGEVAASIAGCDLAVMVTRGDPRIDELEIYGKPAAGSGQ